MVMRAMVVQPGRTGMPEDVFVNTFYFDTGSAEYLTGITSATDFLPRVWNEPAAPETIPLGQFYSRFTNPAGCTIRFYNMNDPEPRMPTIVPFTRSAGAGASYDLPEEVAMCATYRGAPPLTPRRRGRIYLGPLNSSALDFEADPGQGPSRPVLQFQRVIARAMERLRDDAAAAGIPWVIRSTRAGAAGTGGTNTVNYVPIVSGYVDNAWDTQRRRGVDPTSRVMWPFST